MRPIRVEDLHSRVLAVCNVHVAALVDDDRVWHAELPVRSPNGSELTEVRAVVPVDCHAAVAVPVRHEDLLRLCVDRHIRRLVELRGRATPPGAKCELHDVARRVDAEDAVLRDVGRPELAVVVDREAVGHGEHIPAELVRDRAQQGEGEDRRLLDECRRHEGVARSMKSVERVGGVIEGEARDLADARCRQSGAGSMEGRAHTIVELERLCAAGQPQPICGH